jgi:hypothetical protein
MKSCSQFVACILVAVISVGGLASAQTKHALLIGINTYSPEEGISAAKNPRTELADGSQPHTTDSRFGQKIAWHNLEGPEADVKSLAALLSTFGFTDIHTLTGAQATREEILAEIDKHLIGEPESGDTALFYFAGHGSQRLNSKSSKLDRLDETIVPADAYKGVFDIRDKELGRKFNQAIDKGVRILAIFDSCHSGTMARGAKMGRSRWLPYDDRDAADGGDYSSGGKPQPEPPAKRGAIIISAALSTQSADEVEDGMLGGVHGIFTAAFIRSLRSSTPQWTALDVVNSTISMIQADGWTQQPTIEGAAERPLFGGFTVGSIHATVRDAKSREAITLDVGSVLGVGANSEFESMAPPTAKLQVIEVTGPASSQARISEGRLNDVHAGDLFKIKRLSVPNEAKLTVFVPEAVGSEDVPAIQAQISKLKGAAGWSLVNDPAAELPTNLIYWRSEGWQLTGPTGFSANLGAVLSDDLITKRVQRGARVFVSVPPTHGLIRELKQQKGILAGAIGMSGSLANSQYLLAGRLASPDYPGVVEYSLILPGVFGAINPSSTVRSMVESRTIFCSTDSAMPLESNWVRILNGTDESVAANEIENAAAKLGRDRSWLTLDAHNGGQTWPYRLVVRSINGDRPIGETPLRDGDKYNVSLVADPGALSRGVDPQYVYLFGLTCDGSGTLLYPAIDLGGGAPLPLLTSDDKGTQFPVEIPLVRNLRVTPPLGLDTMLLLLTPERIPDLGAFTYSGVLAQGLAGESRGSFNELENLVRGISGRTRGYSAPISATWSIQKVSIRSH